MNRRIVNLPKLASLVLGTLLAGCASAPPAPVRVGVPVIVPCVSTAPPLRPSYDFDSLSATATDGEIILALARDWPRGRNYEAELRALISACM